MWGCSGEPTPEEIWPVGRFEDLARLRERDDLNVVLALVDTLRADHLGAWGYARDTSPLIDQLAGFGVRFARVRAQSSWTKASMASLWTATFPDSNGVQRYSDALDASARMPAEALKEAGFATGGIYRNGWVASNFGFAQGFDLYYKPAPGRPPEVVRQVPSAHRLRGTDADVTRAAMEFVRAHREQRFFLYLHLMDVHQYTYDADSALFGTRLVDAYDNAIHWTDRNLGALVAELEDLDLLRRTLLVVASDHGEAFLEHGAEGHGRNLYTEVTHVPLVIAFPFRLPHPVVVEPWVRNVDLWPTLFDLLGLPPLPEAEGVSLVPLIEAAVRDEGQQAGPPDPTFSILDRAWGRVGSEPQPVASVTRWPHRLISAPDGPAELYEIASDPGERQDLTDLKPELAEELLSLLRGRSAGTGASPLAREVELDELHLQQLRALGYVVGPR